MGWLLQNFMLKASLLGFEPREEVGGRGARALSGGLAKERGKRGVAGSYLTGALAALG